MHNDYLVILGLQNGASEQEIKKAYRELAKKYHPDVNTADGSRDKFLQVTEAYKFLMMAGPRPNQEDIRYDYNPYAQQYERWREQARTYARQKTAEAEQLQMSILQKIYLWFNYINIAILAFNALIIVDNFLPAVSHLQRILSVSEIYYRPSPNAREIHMYDKIIFEDFQLRVDRTEGAGIGDSRALIYTSPILGFIHYAEIQIGENIRRLNPVYGIYTIFKIMVPLALIFGIAYYFMATTHINKITVVVVVTVVCLIEFIMLLAFEY